MNWSWRISHLLLMIASFGPVMCKFDRKGPDIFNPQLNFTFTQVSYNGSVEENSAGSTLIIPAGEKMGIWYESNPSGRFIEYKIVNGDPLKLFRVEERQVGNFCFLIIRVNNNERSLNREFKDLYRLQVKATLYLIENEIGEENNSIRTSRMSTDEKEQLSSSIEKSKAREEELNLSKQKITINKGNQYHRHKESFEMSSSVTTKQSPDDDDDKSLVLNDFQLVKPPHGPSEVISDEHHLWSSPHKSQRKKSLSSSTNLHTKLSSANKRNKTSFRRARDELKVKSKVRNRNRNSSSGESRRKKFKDKMLLSSTTLSSISSSSISQVPITSTPPSPPVTTTDAFSTKKSVLVPISEAYTTIYITIKDVNDNIPVFEHQKYDIGVNSDAAVLSKVAKISANDADVDLNQETYYSLTEFSPLFAIDPITAVLSPVRPIASSSTEKYQILVRAKNRWNTGLVASESTARVNIHIRPTNRKSPQIFVNHPPKIEWRPYGVIFAVVSVRHSGIVDLIIKEGDPNGNFRVTRTTSYNEFYVEMPPIVASNLNYKELTPNVFNLTLKATDRGDPPKSSLHDLQLRLSDGPWSTRTSSILFDKDVYEVKISESAPPHSVVFRLRRPDARVILSISSGNEGQEFTLEKSGVLYTARWLDMESKSSYTLTVDSLDLRPGRIDQVRKYRSVVKIIVRVLDENDNSPVFQSLPGNSSIVYVVENEPIGTKLFKVTARDRDSAENSYITYSISNLKPLPVTIDHFTGEVRTLESLDAEKSRLKYTIRIRASDWGQPYRRESEISVTLILKGSNDNRPLFTVANCVAVIDRNIKFETEFGKLGAIDFDRNDVISYRIVGGNEDGCFSLDPTLGRLRVTCDLRDLRASTRYLNVTASDGEFYSDVHTIKIELRDVLRTNFNKSDSIRTGIKLYSTSQSVFECQDTGVQERFDRLTALFEENNKIENEMDENAFSRLPNRYNENSHSPQFLEFPNELTVNEEVEVGSVVYKLKGKDLDRGYNGLLSFVISGGDETHGAWDIKNVKSSLLVGEIIQEAHLVVASKLDREEFSSYLLNISIWDQGNPPKVASRLLSIKIADTNDCQPAFDKAAMRVKVLEGEQLIGKTISQMRATDCDLEGTPNSLITYRFLKESNEFSIDEETGEIKMLVKLDREKQESYELVVIAQDKGVPQKLSSLATVTIIVEDRNDEKPTFLNVSKVVKIKEDWPIGAVVTKVLAKDEDSGLFGTVRYSLLDGSRGDFVMDPISGVLRVSKELDYEKTFLYNLTIAARDLGVPSLSSETFIVVEILNVQETMEPTIKFPDIVSKTSVTEESPIGTYLYTVMPANYLSQFAYPGILFSLEGDSKFYFTIDSKGTLRTARVLDYEHQSSHWLTIIAQSGINSNNFAQMEMFIEVLPVNDCVPLTKLPIYEIEVEENTPGNFSVLHLKAFDCDDNNGFRFALKTSNPSFQIDSTTGEVRTTAVPLDREKQSELSFDVIVFDMGTPQLNSTTKVSVKILDQNDNSPVFLDQGSIRTIPELINELVQEDEAGELNENDETNQVDVDNEEFEDSLKWSDWQVIHVSEVDAIADGWRKLYRIVAYDDDSQAEIEYQDVSDDHLTVGSNKQPNNNGKLRYRLKYRVNAGATSQETEIFSIHYESGVIYTSANVIKGETIIKFIIEASDLGTIPLTTETHLILKVKEVNRQESLVLPKVLQSNDHKVTITTKEKPGYIVEVLDVIDEDSDQLWYEIVSGDPNQHFFMYPDSPNLILAKSIYSQESFQLNISVTDGFNLVYTRLTVNVIESERISTLIWEQDIYHTAISELVSDSLIVATVRVKDTLQNINSNWTTSNTAPILYGFHNAQALKSLKIFTIDALTGVVTVAQPTLIDRESLSHHILTLKARDPFNTLSFVRLHVDIVDENDNFPIFTTQKHEVRISESTAVGTFLTQIQAFDADSGENGRLSYSITFGNVGNTFKIEKNSGRLFLKRELSVPKGETILEYNLIVKAIDHGNNSLSATTNVNVVVTLQSESEFLQLDCSNEDEPQKNEMRVQVKENSFPGTYVTTIHVVNSGSVSFEIEENKNNFWIDPSTGVILVGKNKEQLDREIKSSHDLVVRATNSRGISAVCNVKIIIQDINDHRPKFTETYLEGELAEDALLGSLVMARNTALDSVAQKPLVLHSSDLDEGSNAIVTYSIVEDEEMRTVFHMVPSSGSLNLVTTLDYEKRSNYVFHVRAVDGGGLLSENMAVVNVTIRPVNNKVPVVKSARVEFLVPTTAGVVVHTVEAYDADGDSLQFNITRGNMDKLFDIESPNGKIIVGRYGNYSIGKHVLEICATDGKFTATATITIHVKLLERNPFFGFRNATYYANAVENSTKVVNVLSLSVFGIHMNEIVQFSILNPSPYFRIGKTSGVILTSGEKLDREIQSSHQLLVQVLGDEHSRISRSIVEIRVQDVNDQCPVFYNLPYYAVVPLDSKSGDFIMKVKALDDDEGENKLVRYELVRSPFGDFYEMDKQLGEIRLRRRLDGIGNHEIIIKAYDGGMPTCTSEAVVEVKIVSQDQPVFEKQWYEVWIPEASKLQSTVLTVEAYGKNPILYTIDPPIDEFAIEHSTGTIYVNSILNYETVQSYSFTVKVTDIINSTWSSSLVRVNIRDSNDNAPKFEKIAYTFRIPEGYMPVNGIIGTLNALDNDTLENSVLTYEIVTNEGRNKGQASDASSFGKINTQYQKSIHNCDAANWFSIHPNHGLLLLKHPLDYNLFHECSFTARVSDSGYPVMNSDARVNIQVINTNKNAPIFEQSVYNVRVSEDSRRNQFIAKVSALDPDFDIVHYAIVSNSYPEIVFSIDENTGILTLSQPSFLLSEIKFVLNISATDHIFTSYCKVDITVDPKNNAIPYFSSLIYEVGCVENCEGCLVATIQATDPDRSIFGQITYSIADTDDNNLFIIDNDGVVRLAPGMSLDRERKDSHTLEIRAEDGGGWLGYTKMVVKVGDINEFPPQFSVPEYRVTISAKKAKTKQPILQVNAIDLDTEFGVHYSIIDLASQNSTLKDANFFVINPDTGEIRFKSSINELPGFGDARMDFQFWVKAQDEQGLDSHVPIKVIVLMDAEKLPEMSPQNATFFVKEDAPIGSIVTTFKVTNIDIPQFRVVSWNSDLFQVDLQGNLLLKSRLDQEQTDKHTVRDVIIWAESQDGINVATSQVTIRVLVSKDKEHPPHFNSNKYTVKIAEDMPEGSLIFTAHAVDSDKSGSVKVKERYVMLPENHNFAINPEYGWITLMNKLDYETNTQHMLHVIATDNEKRQATATVIVEVLNVNDVPTTFLQKEYFAEVSEDMPIGTSVQALGISDLDYGLDGKSTTIATTYLKFYIADGNDQEYFKINENGQVTTWRSLDCEAIHSFSLRIAVTDGSTSDYTNLTIKVLDKNDNVPVCPVPEYEQHVPESALPGTFLLIIEAYDPDYSALSPFFSLMGEGSNHFKIDEESGIVSVGDVTLDAEGQFQPYILTVVSRDREAPFEECSSILKVYIDDVNDYSPQFSEEMYNFAVKEDAVAGSWIGNVHAIDKDIEIVNHKVHYLLLTVTTGTEFVKNQFEVNSVTGIISLLRPLDRELISDYNLSIQATDTGNPVMSSVVQVHIEVRDVNDNEPVFEHNYYNAAISELAEMSTEVLRVRATSKDIGVNAEITYEIIGGNSYNHFSIHKKTGVISVNASLDYERVREYVLTVRAKDAGIPPLYQQCIVNISLLDANDNQPLFNQNSYSVVIAEDAAFATKVIQVTATDIDSGINSLIRYKLGNGDRMNNFQIDSNGVISVASALDREMIPNYTLEIWAIDSGSPSLSSQTTVSIEIIDVNDEKPIFSQESYSTVVQEDRPIGYTVLTFEVNDADAFPNSSPFSWDLNDVDDEKGILLPFTISDLGTLNVAGKLNFQRKQIYRLRVRVFDSGNPPLYSDANVTVTVVGASHWPPVVSSLSVTILSANIEYPAGIPLGKIHATDFDIHDKLVYSVMKTQSSSTFVIDPLNGTLKSLTPLREGLYDLGIAVTDGRWTARGDAKIKVLTLANLLPDVQLEANQINVTTKTQPPKSRKDLTTFAVIITVKGHSPKSLLNRMFAFVNAIKEAIGTDSASSVAYDVVILSLQSSSINSTLETGHLHFRKKRENEIPFVDILLGVRKSSDGTFVQSQTIVKKLRFALAQIEAVLSAKVTRIINDICDSSSCERGQCKTIAIFEGTQSLISTETMSLITPNHYLDTLCYCQTGYGGTRCEKVINACANSNCHVTGHICVPDTSPNGYACLCRKTYCSQDGSCEDQCMQQSFSFSGTSFLAYNVGSNLERELSISFKIKTLYASGTLLYSFGLFDYAILEIKQGLIQFSVDLGTGKEVLTLTSISVSDNRWHGVVLHLKDNYAILRVDERSTLRQRTQGPARSLHTGGVLYVGAKVIGTPNDSIENLIPSTGFVGCMKDLRYGYVLENSSVEKKNDLHIQEVKHYITPGRIPESTGIHPDHDDDEPIHTIVTNGNVYPLPLHNSLKDKAGPYLIWSRNISFTCERILHLVESCKSQPCQNGGICVEDRNNGYKCDCPIRFQGVNCEIDLDPCASNPCLNNGKCSPANAADISFSPSLVSGSLQNNQFHCTCTENTFGSRCERGKWCKDSQGDSDVCHSRGECEEGPVGPVCWCELGYTGATCQLDINECERGDACGAGSTCVNFLGGFRCLCPENANGRTCNQRSTDATSVVTNDYHIVLLIIVVVASFILFLIIFVIIRRCCCRRRRRALTNTIALTASQGKDKDNRIPIGRDNREILRNRDSKISNLEMQFRSERPVSAGSDIFPTDLRTAVDPIKSYGSAADDLEKPQFINNLMKGSTSDKKYGQPSWDTNRDDYPKIQNYMKGEITWGSKGSKPNSPVRIDTSSNLAGGGKPDTESLGVNISPTRMPPPPPCLDIPDTLSNISHDSNTEISEVHVLPSATSGNMEENSPDSHCTDEGTSCDENWALPNPEYCLLNDTNLEGPISSKKPLAIRNRYRRSPNNNSSFMDRNSNSDDEANNENSQLLTNKESTATSSNANTRHHPAGSSSSSLIPKPSSSSSTSSPRNVLPSSSNKTSNFENSNSTRSNIPRKNYRKTTHITEV